MRVDPYKEKVRIWPFILLLFIICAFIGMLLARHDQRVVSEAADEMIPAAYDDGYSRGYEEGYEAGKEAGYDIGYEDGYKGKEYDP